ncbi:mitochondrial nicotinamide adenine dinucleotide transporter SLC25A51-like [Watersipora subatra]|uniref:mitochondrial nicotinamide adenine dinucleotide transporter SLC25A51-like n=1 Tax=Watersipora subatra TaxID=2589382 RepID=UPI00355BE2E4
MTRQVVQAKMSSSKSDVFHPKEFVCGGAAAFTNITITYPMYKVMFRQQLHGIRTHRALSQVYLEGARSLYRGLLSPLLQKTLAMSIMFGMYEQFRLYLSQTTTWNKHTSVAVAAIGAGCIEAALCPFERVQVLMQDRQYHGNFRNTFHAAMELRAYGVREYYRGLSCILMRNGPSNTAFFLCRQPLKQMLPQANSQLGNLCTDFISGAVLGASISTAFYPLNVVKTRMQSKMGGEFRGIVDTFNTVFNERNRSWRKMFRGVNVNFSRSLLSWGIINASYELYWNMLTHSFSSNE